MNLQIFITASILLSCAFNSYGLTIKKSVPEDQTTTFRVPGIQDDEVQQVFDDENPSTGSQPVPTTVLPQSDGIEIVTENAVADEPEFSPEFKYPVVPDPDANLDYTTVSPIPDDFNIADLNVTVQDNVVNGRASCACGRPSGRIIGGSEARINELPWTAALVRGGINAGGRPYCGATLINSRYVLTASHCVDKMQAHGISVRLNQENIYNSPHVQSYGVSRIIMHPNYNRNNIDNDIALVQLSQPVQLDGSSTVTPVCLPASNNFDVSGSNAIVAGWGATAQGGSISSTLRKVTVPVLTNEQCNRESRYSGKITENMMCAGEMKTGGKDSCQGDSGGPLIVQNGPRATLIGVVSWGYGCAQPLSPGVYARVSRYPDWILANSQGADWCQG